MLVYRITLAKWAKQLQGSGYPARWNSKGNFVIYTACSRALATLENLVHRSGEGLMEAFKLIIIDIPKQVKIKSVNETKLSKHWHKPVDYSSCQKLGDSWIIKNSTAVLKVPSAIIPGEYNYLINPNHQHFKQIKIIKVSDFSFDERLI